MQRVRARRLRGIKHEAGMEAVVCSGTALALQEFSLNSLKIMHCIRDFK